jgi:hypothetical protein
LQRIDVVAASGARILCSAGMSGDARQRAALGANLKHPDADDQRHHQRIGHGAPLITASAGAALVMTDG